MEQNDKKQPNKKGVGCLTIIIIFAVIIIIAVSGGKNKDSGNSKSNHIYDTAQVHDVINGSGNAKIGEYSVVKASSSEITDVIVYTDIDGVGVYSSSGMVVKDAGLNTDSNGDYSYSSRNGETTYWEHNNTLELDTHE